MLDIILILAVIGALGTFALIPTRNHIADTGEMVDTRTEAQRVADMLESGHVAGIREMAVR